MVEYNSSGDLPNPDPEALNKEKAK